MPTPNIDANGEYKLFEDLAPELQTTTVDLLYVTDRAPEPRDGGFRYGYGRSTSLAFGSCMVEIGQDLDWQTLVANTTRRHRSVDLPLNVRSIVERGRLAPTPLPLVERDGVFVSDPAAVASQEALVARFHDEIRRRLAFTPVHDAFVYVHGYQNSFDYAAGIVTEFWHFGGRAGVPILYSWPAGSPGLLKGYNHDRESGEFTILHLKQLIRSLSQMPELGRIHVVAHSRGTDVAASALRELLIEERGAGRLARDTFKLGQVVLASPDIDLDVVSQRFQGERFFQAAEHITIYVSSEDRAIGMAEWLYRSRQRLGKVRPEDISGAQLAMLEDVGRLDIVDARVETGFLGHSYYHSNPAVSSDLILLLRYGADAGSPQRPLRRAASRYWVLEDEAYPGVNPSGR
jgi:esterase/lipase superfamily enzyme